MTLVLSGRLVQALPYSICTIKSDLLQLPALLFWQVKKKGANAAPFFLYCEIQLPDFHPLFRRQVQGIGLGNFERFVKLRHVPDYTVNAVLSRRMRVCTDLFA